MNKEEHYECGAILEEERRPEFSTEEREVVESQYSRVAQLFILREIEKDKTND